MVEFKTEGLPNKAGVYMMIFDDSFFYIGSSKSIRKRASAWKTALLKGGYENRLIVKLFEDVKVVNFKVLELIDDIPSIAYHEAAHIGEYWGDERLMNQIRTPMWRIAKNSNSHSI